MGEGKLHSDPCLCSYPHEGAEHRGPQGCPAQAGSRSQISPAQAWPRGPDQSMFPGVLGEGVSKGPARWGGKTPLAPLPFQLGSCPVCVRLKRHFIDVCWVGGWTNYLLPKSQVLLEPPTMQNLCEDWLRAELWAQHHWTWNSL